MTSESVISVMVDRTTDTPQSWASATPSLMSSSPLSTYAEVIALSLASTMRSRTIRESTPFCLPPLSLPSLSFTPGMDATAI